MGILKPQSNGPLYSNTVIGMLSIDWVGSYIWYSEEGHGCYYSMWHCNYLCTQKGLDRWFQLMWVVLQCISVTTQHRYWTDRQASRWQSWRAYSWRVSGTTRGCRPAGTAARGRGITAGGGHRFSQSRHLAAAAVSSAHYNATWWVPGKVCCIGFWLHRLYFPHLSSV